MDTGVHQPLALQACKRCSKRKKKCDRLIPHCSACETAGEQCVYVDKTLGYYSIEYVRGLEEEIIELKRQIAEKSRFSAQNKSTPEQFEHLPDVPRNRKSLNTLEQDFAHLTLRASGDGKYLGPGSGISFAKFTQSFIYQLDSKNDNLLNDGIFLSDKPKNGVISPENSIPRSPLPVLEEISKSNPFADTRLPDIERTRDLVTFYLKHSHTLYPFIRTQLFTDRLEYMFQPDPSSEFAGIESNPLWLFEMFMVMAIGSTCMATITVSNEDEAMVCYQAAMNYLPSVLSQGSSVSLEGLMLLISYSFFNRTGPDTWYLVGIASRLALGMGLHKEKCLENLSETEKEHTRTVFWSIYMMDRVVSTTLGRPLAIRDMDVDISQFSPIQHDGEPCIYFRVTIRTIELRRIAGEILEQVYNAENSQKTAEERSKIVSDLHQKLIEWRVDMPVLDDEHSYSIPHFSAAWIDLNYYHMILMLFRPSPLWPQPPAEHFHLIAEASTKVLKQFYIMYLHQRLSFNWLNLLSVFGACLSLIFITNSQPEWNTKHVSPTEAITVLSHAEKLFERFSVKFAPAKEFRQVALNAMEDILKFAESSPLVQTRHGYEKMDDSVDPIRPLFYMTNDRFYDDMLSQIDDGLLNAVQLNENEITEYSNFFLDSNYIMRR